MRTHGVACTNTLKDNLAATPREACRQPKNIHIKHRPIFPSEAGSIYLGKLPYFLKRSRVISFGGARANLTTFFQTTFLGSGPTYMFVSLAHALMICG
jgi:hypothetical protein